MPRPEREQGLEESARSHPPHSPSFSFSFAAPPRAISPSQTPHYWSWGATETDAAAVAEQQQQSPLPAAPSSWQHQQRRRPSRTNSRRSSVPPPRWNWNWTRSDDNMLGGSIDFDDDDDDFKPPVPATGSNALPISPPARALGLPPTTSFFDPSLVMQGHHPQARASPSEYGGSASSSTSSSSSSPTAHHNHHPFSSPSPMSSSLGSSSEVTHDEQHRHHHLHHNKAVDEEEEEEEVSDRDVTHARPCSFLQPGMVFKGYQSFTTYSSPSTSSSYVPHPHPAVSSPVFNHAWSSFQRHSNGTSTNSSWRQHVHVHQHHHQPQQQAPLQQRRTQEVHPSSRFPFSTYASDLPSWDDIQGSAIDPRIQALLSASPAYQYDNIQHQQQRQRQQQQEEQERARHVPAEGVSKEPHCNREEWEVHVSISSVDYAKGKMTGIMTALNVPNPCAPSTSSSSSSSGNSSDTAASAASSSSHLRKREYANTVTTSFEGEIVDLRNHTLWTRATPESWHSYLDKEDESRNGSGYGGASLSWLATHGAVDKTTDLEYWSKVEAFAGFGANAEKEICRIAREGQWQPRSSTSSSRSRNNTPHSTAPPRSRGGWHIPHSVPSTDPRDYILMRWKERDFIDCEASSSGLTISGFYYICLSRRTGSLSGFYYDPMSTPHQRLELEPAKTKLARTGSHDRSSRSSSSSGNGFATADVEASGTWFGSYEML